VITREQAEQALACIRRQFRVEVGIYGSEPKLIENWKPFVWEGREVHTEPVPFAILWEEGPDHWAERARTGGVDEELTLEARDFDKNYVVETPAATGWPEGVGQSAYFSWVLTLYSE
jgi:hypothetical protein